MGFGTHPGSELNVSITLHLDFGRTCELADLPRRAIALDGYVRGPAIDTANERYSFDHHEGCIRHVTTATCVQVLDALLLGLDPAGFHVFVNDVDADTVLAVYLLQNPACAHDPSVRELVEGVGKIDAHGPAYPLPDRLLERVNVYLEDVLAPERQMRKQGTYEPGALATLLEQCLARTQAFFDGTFKPGPVREPTPYRVLYSAGDMAMIQGDRAMTALAYRDGWKVVIAILPAKDGTTAYTIAKQSEFVPFNVPKALQALTVREPGWGGGTTVGGAPRHPDGTRSRLTPEEVWNIVRSSQCQDETPHPGHG